MNPRSPVSLNPYLFAVKTHCDQVLQNLFIDMFLDYSLPEYLMITLPNLRTIQVITSTFRSGDLKALTALSLPSLQNTVISSAYREENEDIDFFTVHGSSILNLDIAEVTGIPEPVLRDFNASRTLSVTERLAWMEHRSARYKDAHAEIGSRAEV